MCISTNCFLNCESSWVHNHSSVAMSGKTTATFRCPCTDVLEGPGGWPSVLSGRCFRCHDQWVATHLHRSTDPDTAELGTYAVRRRSPRLRRSNEVVSIVQSVWELRCVEQEEVAVRPQENEAYLLGQLG